MSPELIVRASMLIVMLFGAVFTVYQLRYLRTQSRNKYEWNRRVEAISYSLIKSQRLREARIELDKHFGILSGRTEALTIAELDKEIEKNPALHTDILYALAHWENMALAIHAGIADEDVAFEMVAGMVIQFVSVFHNFIERRKGENPRAYEYLTRLSVRWQDRLKSTDKPIFADIS